MYLTLSLKIGHFHFKANDIRLTPLYANLLSYTWDRTSKKIVS